jgi:hypothetical protein
MKREEEKEEDIWSEWLDFSQSKITAVIPEKPGVFKVHTSSRRNSINDSKSRIDILNALQ